MKKKIAIIFLIIGFSCIIGGGLYYVLKPSTPSNEKPEEKPKEEVYMVDGRYSCKREMESFDDEWDGVPMKFHFTSYYDFSYKEGEILYGNSGVEYQFLDQASFDSFRWTEKNSSSPPDHQTEDSEKLTKNLSWLMIIGKKEPTDGIEEYLEQLASAGFLCVKSGE